MYLIKLEIYFFILKESGWLNREIKTLNKEREICRRKNNKAKRISVVNKCRNKPKQKMKRVKLTNKAIQKNVEKNSKGQ